MTPTIIILALLAAFLGLRLYSALGKHGTDMEAPLPRGDDRPMIRPAAAKPAQPQALDGAVSEGMRSIVPAQVDGLIYEPAAEIGIRAILSADRSFDVGRFVHGAKAAYGMILEAYWRGDREELRGLCDADSYEAFAEAISAREARGETLDNRLIVVDSATIVDAGLAGGRASIVVRFDADIAAVTRDADGNAIAGSMTDATPSHDVWSFVRQIGSRDPSWLLDETDAA